MADTKSGATAASTGEPLPVSGPDVFTLPLTSILSEVPTELHGHLAASAAGAASFSLPRQQVLEQLPKGSVKVSFGELRKEAPVGVFINSSSHDNKLVSLPLKEILSQLAPASFARRSNQRAMQVDNDVPDLFNAQGGRLTQVRVLSKEEALKPVPGSTPAPPAAAPKSAPAAKPATPLPSAAPASPARPKPTTKAKSEPASKAAPAAQTPPIPAPAMAGPANTLVVPLLELTRNWPDPVRQEVVQLDPNPQCAIPLGELGDGLKLGKVTFPWAKIFSWIHPRPSKACAAANAETILELPIHLIAPLYINKTRTAAPQKKVGVSDAVPDVFSRAGQPLPPAPAAAPAAAAKPSAPRGTAAAKPAAPETSEKKNLTIGLTDLWQNWPEAIRKEIDHLNLAVLPMELPMDVIEMGLRQGKVDFLWKQICGWVQNCPPAAPSAANADVRLELPLPVLAPLFLRHRPAPQPKRDPIAFNIPDVFSPDGKILNSDEAAESSAPAAASAQPVAPMPPAARPPGGAAAPTKAPPQDIAELFGEPEKRNWTPNDIVHKSTHLTGVAGAIIALQDGLLVAHCMPPTWNTETIAAFLPQIFGRMTQYSKELKIGELKSLTLSVDNGTLQIFNAGIIYFAALSKPDALLPVPELNIIANELSRHTK